MRSIRSCMKMGRRELINRRDDILRDCQVRLPVLGEVQTHANLLRAIPETSLACVWLGNKASNPNSVRIVANNNIIIIMYRTLAFSILKLKNRRYFYCTDTIAGVRALSLIRF